MNNKKAIKSLKEFAYTTHGTLSAEEAKIVLNLIEKLQKANKELTKSNKTLSKTVDLMKEVINEMAKHIYLLGYYDCLYEVCDDDMDRECEDCIKEYFYKKVKETKDNGSTKKL